MKRIIISLLLCPLTAMAMELSEQPPSVRCIVKIVERIPQGQNEFIEKLLAYASRTYKPGLPETTEYKCKSKVHDIIFFSCNVDIAHRTGNVTFEAIYDPTKPFPLESLHIREEQLQKAYGSLLAFCNPLAEECNTPFTFDEPKTYTTYQPNVMVKAGIHIIKRTND